MQIYHQFYLQSIITADILESSDLFVCVCMEVWREFRFDYIYVCVEQEEIISSYSEEKFVFIFHVINQLTAQSSND